VRAIDLISDVLAGRVDEAVELVPAPDPNGGVRYDVLYNVEDGHASFMQIRVGGQKYIVTLTEAKDA
jgi:hypothetical protein